MRVSKRMMAGRWMCIFSSALILLGLAALGLPQCHAQMRYSGGFVQSHRHPPTFPAEPAKTAPAEPPSYFPDNDFRSSFYYAGEEPGRLLAFGVAAVALPWNQLGFVDYNEPLQVPRDKSVSEPKKYTLEVMTVPQQATAARSETAVLIAHLPEQAAFWVEGARTRSTGRTRYFQSPPLLPGRKYAYRVRAVWLENGQWVSQTRTIPVQASVIQSIYLQPALAIQGKIK